MDEHFFDINGIARCVGYGNRLRMQQLQQKDWIDQQIRERNLY